VSITELIEDRPADCAEANKLMRGGFARRFAIVALVAGLIAGFIVTQQPARPVEAACISETSISSNFNGTAIPGGRYIWFSAVMKASGIPSTGTTITFSGGKVSSAQFNQTVPNAVVIYSPSTTAASATTTYDAGTNTFTTTVPLSSSGNTLITGYALPVPAAGYPGGLNPVTLSGKISTSSPGVGVNWQWAAAGLHAIQHQLQRAKCQAAGREHEPVSEFRSRRHTRGLQAVRDWRRPGRWRL
jgi:hypothetical protein